MGIFREEAIAILEDGHAQLAQNLERLSDEEMIGAIRGITDEEWEQQSLYPIRHAFGHVNDLEKFVKGR